MPTVFERITLIQKRYGYPKISCRKYKDLTNTVRANFDRISGGALRVRYVKKNNRKSLARDYPYEFGRNMDKIIHRFYRSIKPGSVRKPAPLVKRQAVRFSPKIKNF